MISTARYGKPSESRLREGGLFTERCLQIELIGTSFFSSGRKSREYLGHPMMSYEIASFDMW
ncbi:MULTISPECIES: hypothetical protein [unclassified Bartonella]|uniref:hypothetical protein n=1 Tax=unclassified Bartonella TaxID=2645622 RepID=UPI0035D02FDF